MSAGFAPIAIGGETDGSIIMPSNRAALYSLKPTIGLISTQGTIPINPLFDTLGPMAKTAVDLGILLDVMTNSGDVRLPKNYYAKSAHNRSWMDLKVGVLDPKTWHQPPYAIKSTPGTLEQTCKEINAAYDTIQPLAGKFHRNVKLVSPSMLMVDGRHATEELICKYLF